MIFYLFIYIHYNIVIFFSWIAIVICGMLCMSNINKIQENMKIKIKQNANKIISSHT